MVTLWVSLGLLLLSSVHSALRVEHPFYPRHHGAAKVMRFSKAPLIKEPLSGRRALYPCVVNHSYQDGAHTGKKRVVWSETTMCKWHEEKLNRILQRILHWSWGQTQSYWGEVREPGEGASRCLNAQVDLSACQVDFPEYPCACMSMCVHMHLLITRSWCLRIMKPPCPQCLKTKTTPTGLQIDNWDSGGLMAAIWALKDLSSVLWL